MQFTGKNALELTSGFVRFTMEAYDRNQVRVDAARPLTPKRGT